MVEILRWFGILGKLGRSFCALRRLLAAILILCSCASLVAVTPTTGYCQAPLAAATGCDVPCQALHLLQALQQQKGIPGIQIAVSVKGQAILSQGLGYADVANQLPVTTSTQFRIGSIPKSLTSAALLKLLEGFKPKLTRLLFASQTTRAGRSVHYGLGWHVGLTASGHWVYWHDGLVAGGSGYLLLYPDDKIVVSILANSRLGHDLPAQALGELFLANY